MLQAFSERSLLVRLYSDGLGLGIWFKTSCRFLGLCGILAPQVSVSPQVSMFWSHLKYIWFGLWYTTLCIHYLSYSACSEHSPTCHLWVLCNDGRSIWLEKKRLLHAFRNINVITFKRIAGRCVNVHYNFLFSSSHEHECFSQLACEEFSLIHLCVCIMKTVC